MCQQDIYIHEIATTVPEHFYTQQDALKLLLELVGNEPKKRNFLTRVYNGSAIDKRHTVISDYGKHPEEFTFYPPNKKMLPQPDTMARNDLYIKEAGRLAEKACRQLLAVMDSSITGKITHLITVSCTGFSAPGFDLHLIKALELSGHVHRSHIGFMGCYAAFPAMKLARDICRSNPEARVLMVNVELCSLHFQQSDEADIMVANAIFSDGISAALISGIAGDSQGPKIILHHFLTQYLEGSEQDMAWKIGQHGFDMKLSAYVPRLLNEHIEPIIGKLYDQSGIKSDEVAYWAIHPGGKAILEKLGATLKLSREDLDISYDVLKEYGNMSSSTLMFVLKRMLDDQRQGKMVALGFGPGLTIETGYLEKTDA